MFDLSVEDLLRFSDGEFLSPPLEVLMEDDEYEGSLTLPHLTRGMAKVQLFMSSGSSDATVPVSDSVLLYLGDSPVVGGGELSAM